VTQHVDVGDRLPTIGEHHRHIGQHPAPIMTRGKSPTCQRLGDPPIRPVRSASSRRPALSAWATTPVPSPDTDNPADHDLRFTYGVPSGLRNLNLRKSKNPLPDRHFRAFTRRQPHYP
jgi:hypothetical protein